MAKLHQTVGIIGFGRMGQLLARLLKEDFEVFASNLSDKSAAAEKIGVSYVPVAEAAAKGIVVLAVPISEMEAALRQIKPHLKSGAVVMDTCSVKEYPLMIMQEILPRTVEILGTHPLFGPDSFSDPEARKIVLCPARRGEASAEMRRYLERKGFKTIIASPEEHDRAIALALNIPQLIGKVLNRISFQALLGSKISTLNSRRLLLIAASVSNDSERLLKDIHAYNRFAHQVEERFGNEVTSVVDEFRRYEKANASIVPAAGALTATAATITSATTAKNAAPEKMREVKVAFQGEHGAYSEMACRKFFWNRITTASHRALKDVFVAVEDDNADFGVVPVENSVAGDVHETYDLLLEFSLHVCGEVYQPIEHCLIGQKGASAKDVRRVYSHAQALAQCDKFLESINAERIAVYDTAGAVAIVKKSGHVEEAAIASELAARIHGMEVLKKRIESDKNNTTRFFVISKNEAKKTANMKTSIVFGTRHKPGALYRCLEGFAKNNINLTKLVSRPLKGRRWEYMFYLDFEGGTDNKRVQDAMETLNRNTRLVRILGSYTAGNGR